MRSCGGSWGETCVFRGPEGVLARQGGDVGAEHNTAIACVSLLNLPALWCLGHTLTTLTPSPLRIQTQVCMGGALNACLWREGEMLALMICLLRPRARLPCPSSTLYITTTSTAAFVPGLDLSSQRCRSRGQCTSWESPLALQQAAASSCL
jgi:hypothetical protein